MAALSAKLGLTLLAVSIDRDTSMRSLEVAKRYPGTVMAFVGVHPSEATKVGNVDWLEAMLPQAGGCGEIGMDPKYSETGPGSQQARIYEAMLDFAEKAGKPVQVHSRDAENACLQLLTRYSPRGVLMHWFEKEELVQAVGDRGYYVSFGPALLYSKKLQRLAASIDRSLVLTESDGPVSFGPLGGVGGPPLVPSVAFELARVWKVGFDEASEILVRNLDGYAGSSGKG
jgi:TatD DNase family protein